MARYVCKVAITRHQNVTVYASNDSEAETKAEEIVSGWKDVEEVEVLNVEEE